MEEYIMCKKHVLLIALAALTCFSATGCAEDTTVLSEENNITETTTSTQITTTQPPTTTTTTTTTTSFKANVSFPMETWPLIDRRYPTYTSFATISDLSYESELDYYGNMTLTVNMTFTLDSKVGEENKANSVGIGYKLVDSNNVVIDSGHIYSHELRVGEKSKEKCTIYDLDPSKVYVFTFYLLS